MAAHTSVSSHERLKPPRARVTSTDTTTAISKKTSTTISMTRKIVQDPARDSAARLICPEGAGRRASNPWIMERAALRPLMLALLAAFSTAVPVPASASDSACTADPFVDSFDVAAKARRDVYRIGETALIDVLVTDRFTGTPQEDVDVGVFVEGKGDRVVLDASKTDQNGHALLRLRLKRSHVEPGWAEAFAAAWDPINTPVYCTGRYGYREYPKLFRIRR